MNSDDLPPKEPALYVVGFFVQVWFLMMKPDERAEFLRISRKLLKRNREGRGQSWRPDMDGPAIASTAGRTLNWIARLCDLLERRYRKA